MPRREVPPRCHFCGTKDFLLCNIGIALGRGGNNYAFCEECLKNNSAYKFWYNFFDTLGMADKFPADEDEER